MKTYKLVLVPVLSEHSKLSCDSFSVHFALFDVNTPITGMVYFYVTGFIEYSIILSDNFKQKTDKIKTYNFLGTGIPF